MILGDILVIGFAISGIFHIASKIVRTFSEEQTHLRLSASHCSFKSVN